MTLTEPMDRPEDVDLDDSHTAVSPGLEWYSEGPGRRVGYENLTAIDWIYEYAKERQRLKTLYSSAAGIAGHVKRIYDASEIWLILILAGITSGIVAAFIDVASDWLADLKTGFCSDQKTGGQFYLSRNFCCFGYEELEQCQDWQLWNMGFGITGTGSAFLVNYVLFTLMSITFAVLASVLVKRFSPFAMHSGIPEIKTVLGGFVIRRFMGVWTLAIKSLGLCLAVASGLWLGKEGPLVHVSCCCANLFIKLFPNINRNEARKREAISAAAAAGISVAFASPIGGVLFSLEQLSYYFPDKTMWQSFVCAMVAAVTLQAMDPFRSGKLVQYQVTYHTGWHGFELFPFVVLGLFGGIYGGLFVKLNMQIARWRQRRQQSYGTIREVLLIALVTAIVSFPITFLRAQASELVHLLFAECDDIPDDLLGLCKEGKANTGVIALLLVAALIGFFLASMTFGLALPAGIILPSLATGALYGRAMGLFMETLQKAYPRSFPFSYCDPDSKCITPGTYAIIGAASALAGATRITVSIVVIMFELTGALTYVLPIMIAVMLSKWIGDGITKHGIYEAWISFNGYPFLSNKDEDGSNAPDGPVSLVMTRFEDLCVIEATGQTIHSLQELLRATNFRGYPVVDNAHNPILIGYISRAELTFALSSSRAQALETEIVFIRDRSIDRENAIDLRLWMDQTPITLNSQASLQLTISMFQRLGLRYIIFTERGALRGLLTKKDIWMLLEGAESAMLQTRMNLAGLSEQIRGDQGGSAPLSRHDEDESHFPPN